MSSSTRALALTFCTMLALVGCTDKDGTDETDTGDTDTGETDTDTDVTDTTAPTVAITDDVAAAVTDGDVTFTFAFSEDVGDSFAASDVGVAGGTAGTFAVVDGRTATLVVSPDADTAGTMTVTVAAQTFEDVAGNVNTAATTASQDYDTVIPGPLGTVLMDFESSVDYRGFGGAEGASTVVDPEDAGNQVGRVVKSGTAETWGGTVVTYCPGETTAVMPFTATETKMSMRVWSPDAGIQVRFKVENSANGAETVETEATTTAAGAWEVLEFDFTNNAEGTQALNVDFTFDRSVVFFNFGTTGADAGEKTYYMDDITFLGTEFSADCPPVGDGSLPLDFEDSGTVYTLTGFGGAEDATVVEDPTNTGNFVGKVVKSATAELWAGTTLSTGANQSIAVLPITASATKMVARVWSPRAGIQVRLKIEDATDPTKSVETEASVTTAEAWQTLTFDFSKQAEGTAALNLGYTFNKASIFFDFGKTGADGGGGTFYFDDIDMAP